MQTQSLKHSSLAGALSIADLLGFALVRSTVWLIEHLPETIGLGICRFCVWTLLTLMPRARAVGKRNLEIIFPEKTEAERKAIFRDSLEALARHLFAFCQIPKLTKERAAEMFDYSEIYPVFQRVRAEAPDGVGVLIVTMHFGSFEYLVQAHALIDRPLSLLTRPFGSSRLERWWNERRGYFGNRVFTREGGYGEIVQRLRSGEDVLIVMDQNVRVHHAVFTTFFGHWAATTKSVALAALRTKAPVFFAAAAEISPGKYKMVYSELPSVTSLSGSTEDKILQLTEAIHRAFEKAIRQYPAQWFWIHRRFKTQPVGQVEGMYGGKKIAHW